MKRDNSNKCKAIIVGTVTRLEDGFIMLYNQNLAQDFRIIADDYEECVFALISNCKCKCGVIGSLSILQGNLLDAHYIKLVNGIKIDLVNYMLYYNKRRKEILVKNNASFSSGDMKGKVKLKGKFGYYKGDIVFYDPKTNIIYKVYREKPFHYTYFKAKEVYISGNVESDGSLRVNGISVDRY